MNTKIYEKTRYQNIYRHKKNKNYLVMISKPVKTTISTIDNQKILRIEDALKVRDNPKIKDQKAIEIINAGDFDTFYTKYINWCENVQKLAKNSIIRKSKTYNRYLKNVFKKKLSKINEEDFIYYINGLKCTDKTKNEIIKESKAFLNWCVKQKVLLYNPIINIKKYKVLKTEMKYWTPEEIKAFFITIDNDINNNINKEIAYRTKMFVLLGFSLGARTGEILNLSFSNFSYTKNTVSIKGTKTKKSDREIDVSTKLVDELNKYNWYLMNECDYDIIRDELIFCNHNTKKPITDTTMRKHFYYYCDKADVSKIRMYDLRHTYVATMMLEGKELYHISQRLGHSSYNTTVDKYGHLSNKIRKEIAEITDKYI